MTDVREINDIAALGDVRQGWRRLLAQTPGADFFRTLDWLEVYWRHYGRRQRLRVLMIHEEGELAGIVPLVVRWYWTRLGPFRVLTYPLGDWGSFYGPIGRDASQTLTRGLQYIAQARRDWDLIELRWVEADGSPAEGTARAMRRAGFCPQRRPHTEIPRVDLSGGWDDYWAALGGNFRSVCRRNEKKADARGHVQHQRYRPRGLEHGDGDPRWDLYDACTELAGISWQGSSKTGTTLTHKSVQPFLRDVHQAAAAAGHLDVNLLRIDGVPAAFNYNYVYGGYVSSLRLGFDPRFAQCGVGTVLTCRMLQDGTSRGDRLFDFLPGSLEAKRAWRPIVADSHRYSFIPRTAGRLRLLRWKRRLVDERRVTKH